MTSYYRYREALSCIEVGDWGTAAEILAAQFSADRFLRMDAYQQNVFLQDIAKQLLLQSMDVGYQHLPTHERPIETELAQEIYEKACSLLGFDGPDKL